MSSSNTDRRDGRHPAIRGVNSTLGPVASDGSIFMFGDGQLCASTSYQPPVQGW